VRAAVSRRITVVTAVHAPSATFLPEAYKSLRQQELPDNWEWHWLIQEHGRRTTSGRIFPTTTG
jgi:hypothetical protein